MKLSIYPNEIAISDILCIINLSYSSSNITYLVDID